MSQKAKSVVDVILGEAKAGNYEDMVAIASVISNRAQGAGTSWEDVVSRQSEFNAYNKALPKGVNKYREMANNAVKQVQQNGPVHNATFYATPKAQKNLPKGLNRVTETDGHIYFTDPKERAIYTASGLKQIDYAQVNSNTGQMLAYNDAGLPTGFEAPLPDGKSQITLANAEAPTLAGMLSTGYAPPDAKPETPLDRMLNVEPEARSNRGAGFAALVPSDTYENPQIANIIPVNEYNPRAGRSQMPSSGVVDDYAKSVALHFGPDYSVGVYSGQEPKGADPVGSPFNHPTGRAADMDIIDPSGNRITGGDPEDARRMKNVLVDMAVLEHPVGFGDGYMKQGRAHIGGPSHKIGWGKGGSIDNLDPDLKSDLIRARETGVNHYWDVPTPVSRDEFLSDGQELTSKPSEELSTPNYASEFVGSQDTPQRQVARSSPDAFGFAPEKQQAQPQRDSRYSEYDSYQMNERAAPKAEHANEFMGLDNLDASIKAPDFTAPLPQERPADLGFTQSPQNKQQPAIGEVPTFEEAIKGKADVGKTTGFNVPDLLAKQAKTTAARTVGGMLGGSVGAMIAPPIAQFINQRMFNGKGPFGGMNITRSNAGPLQRTNQITASDLGGSSNSNAVQHIMDGGGERGTYSIASNGSIRTSLGNGQHQYTDSYGNVSIVGEPNINQSADLRDFFSGNSKDDEDEE